MSLFIRVNTTFYSHRKTAKLRAKLGNDAFWLPLRIWAYCADHQPDGNLSSYEPEELANLIGYAGDAPSMLQALLQAGFLDPDPLRVHDWEEHNSYHVKFAEKARLAAEARWNKNRDREEKRREDTRIATGMLQACPKHNFQELALEIYGCYPKKVDKPRAVRAITKALKTVPSDLLREKTVAYARAVAGADPQFIPNPATWFNGERYNDEPATWAKSAGAPVVVGSNDWFRDVKGSTANLEAYR